MSRPSIRTLLVGIGGGAVHLVVVETPFRRLDHVPSALWPLSSADGAVSMLALGFGTVLAVAHTRLVSRPVGPGALLAWATYRDPTTPTPEWSELGGTLVVDGPVFLTSYAGTWDIRLGLFALVAGVECGLRRHHAVGFEVVGAAQHAHRGRLGGTDAGSARPVERGVTRDDDGTEPDPWASRTSAAASNRVVHRRSPADAHEVVEVVDLIGGMTGKVGRPPVGAADERGVDTRVVGGEDVGLVVADEDRRLGVEVLQGSLEVVRRGLLP